MDPRHLSSAAALLAAAALLSAVACGEERDPFSVAAIEADLRNTTPQELYEKAGAIRFDPPASDRLTEEHIEHFVRVARLADRIGEVAAKRLDSSVDRASREPDRLSRMASAASAFGEARNLGTADLRAALTLGVNPHEYRWVAGKIEGAARLLRERREYDEQIDQARRIRDREQDAYARLARQPALDRAEEARRRWEGAQSDAALANVAVVEAHAAELAGWFRQLGR